MDHTRLRVGADGRILPCEDRDLVLRADAADAGTPGNSDQKRKRRIAVVRPPGSVMIPVSAPWNWIVTGAMFALTCAGALYAPVSVWPLPYSCQVFE